MAEMEYIKLPYVDLPVSRILLGTAMPPLLMGEDSNDLLNQIYKTGVNAFDTARNYLHAEKSLGRWIAERNMRDKIVILSKCGHPGADGKGRINEAEIRKDFATSAKLLNTDFIDIYLAHRDDREVFAGLIVEIFNAMHAEGKIGAFGVSNWTHERIEEANEYAYKHQMIPLTPISVWPDSIRTHGAAAACPYQGRKASVHGRGMKTIRCR